MKQLLIFCALIINCVACTSNKADLLITNAQIYTMDSAFSKYSAMAIKDGKILETGATKELIKKYEATKLIDAKEQYIYPGFIDAHCHFYGYGMGLQNADLIGTQSWEEVILRVQKYAAIHDYEWILGRGWDQNDWNDKQFPDNRLLNQLFPDRPVVLTRVDGHAAIANAKALALAGIKAGDTLIGGKIETSNGELTGILIDNAVDLVKSKIPEDSEEKKRAGLLNAQQACFSQGLTSVQDCGLDHQQVSLIQKMQEEKKLKMRTYIMLSDNKSNLDWLKKTGTIRNDMLHVNGFKVYADGALGSRGACLLRPYADMPGWSGFLLSTLDHFDSLAALLHENNWQMCTHAIGDSSNRAVLTIYAKYLQGKNDRRWRIEHAQVVDPADFPLFGAYSIIPSVQPTHATSDMYWAGDRLGTERMAFAYAYQKLWKEIGWLPLGTDFPVEDISPMKTFVAAVFRQDAQGYPSEGFEKTNALTREQSLRGMTIWAAKAAFEEHIKGSLEQGKLADFVMMDTDLLKSNLQQSLNAKVLKTFVGGQQVYSSK